MRRPIDQYEAFHCGVTARVGRFCTWQKRAKGVQNGALHVLIQRLSYLCLIGDDKVCSEGRFIVHSVTFSRRSICQYFLDGIQYTSQKGLFDLVWRCRFGRGGEVVRRHRSKKDSAISTRHVLMLHNNRIMSALSLLFHVEARAEATDSVVPSAVRHVNDLEGRAQRLGTCSIRRYLHHFEQVIAVTPTLVHAVLFHFGHDAHIDTDTRGSRRLSMLFQCDCEASVTPHIPTTEIEAGSTLLHGCHMT